MANRLAQSYCHIPGSQTSRPHTPLPFIYGRIGVCRQQQEEVVLLLLLRLAIKELILSYFFQWPFSTSHPKYGNLIGTTTPLHPIIYTTIIVPITRPTILLYHQEIQKTKQY